MSELHALDKRVTSLEDWREHLSAIDIPSIRETIKTEIPAHYTKRIAESEKIIMLKIGDLITKKLDEKLDKRFGWIPRGLETVITALVVAAILYGLKLA